MNLLENFLNFFSSVNPFLIFAFIPPLTSLNFLMEGNKRFASDKSLHPERTKERRQETAGKQEPFAVILGCSDSRVAPEIIFDQGIGDLFIVRVAGNIISPVVLNSIEYATVYLHSSLILVLGHENCGAIRAVLEGQTKDIEAIATIIKPSVQNLKGSEVEKIEMAVRNNVSRTVAALKTSPILAQLIQEEKLIIRGGYYNFHTGVVELI